MLHYCVQILPGTSVCLGSRWHLTSAHVYCVYCVCTRILALFWFFALRDYIKCILLLLGSTQFRPISLGDHDLPICPSISVFKLFPFILLSVYFFSVSKFSFHYSAIFLLAHSTFFFFPSQTISYSYYISNIDSSLCFWMENPQNVFPLSIALAFWWYWLL